MTAPNPLHARFVFLDIETTGLDPEKGGILQIAASVTDHAFEVLDSFEAWVLNDPTSITFERGALELHVKTGFLEAYNAAVASGGAKPRDLVAAQFAAWLKTYAQAGKLILAGANVESFDRKWLMTHMRGIAPALHYRTINTTSLRLVRASALGVDVSALAPEGLPGKHFAPKDVELALEEARECRALFAKAAGKAKGAA